MTSLSWCKCTNRRCCGSSSIAPQQCIMRPTPHWLDSTRLQTRFLRECGLSDEDALLHFNLAPLEARMLGLMHRSVLDAATSISWTCFGPSRCRFFRNTGSNSVRTGAPPSTDVALSAHGLADVCNLLPEQVVEQESAAALQHELQMLLKFRKKKKNQTSHWERLLWEVESQLEFASLLELLCWWLRCVGMERFLGFISWMIWRIS